MSPFWCGVVTLFPEMFDAITENGITARAVKSGLLALKTWQLRDFADNKHATVDDKAYGGGPGMVLMAPVLAAATKAAKSEQPQAKVIYVSPAGKRFDQRMAREMAAKREPLLFITGRYEGVDQRYIDSVVDESISIGDYVLSGGELPVMVIIDAITRWLPGALGHEGSAPNDAFSAENGGILDYPHYTRPSVWEGQSVPAVLTSGDHGAIATWRRKQALGHTWLARPDLIAKRDLDESSRALLAAFQTEIEHDA